LGEKKYGMGSQGVPKSQKKNVEGNSRESQKKKKSNLKKEKGGERGFLENLTIEVKTSFKIWGFDKTAHAPI